MIPMNTLPALLSFALLLQSIEAVFAEPVAAWRTGFSRDDITPSSSMWMSGYAARDHASEGTRTRLWAKALALEDAKGKRALLVTLDLVGVSRDVTDPVRHEIAVNHQLGLKDVLINCSHTHTGPVVGENLRTMYILEENESQKLLNYTRHLKERLVELADAAFSNLEASRLRAGQSQATFATNRRENPQSHVLAWRASGKLKGPVDYSVPILEIRDMDHQLKGLVFGYACHATVLSDYQWSGDYPGFAQIQLESRYDGIQAMFWAGCGADINPLPRRTAALAEQYGVELAQAVTQGIKGVMDEVSPTLKTDYTEIPLLFAPMPSREDLESEAQSDNPYAASRAQKWMNHMKQGHPLPTSYPYPIGLWRLGNQVKWLTMGGEVVVDFALTFKQTYGRDLWIAGYSHDIMGYIPSRRIWNEGGYEGGGAMVYYGQPTRWSQDVEHQISQAVKSLMSK